MTYGIYTGILTLLLRGNNQPTYDCTQDASKSAIDAEHDDYGLTYRARGDYKTTYNDSIVRHISL